MENSGKIEPAKKNSDEIEHTPEIVVLPLSSEKDSSNCVSEKPKKVAAKKGTERKKSTKKQTRTESTTKPVREPENLNNSPLHDDRALPADIIKAYDSCVPHLVNRDLARSNAEGDEEKRQSPKNDELQSRKRIFNSTEIIENGQSSNKKSRTDHSSNFDENDRFNFLRGGKKNPCPKCKTNDLGLDILLDVANLMKQNKSTSFELLVDVLKQLENKN